MMTMISLVLLISVVARLAMLAYKNGWKTFELIIFLIYIPALLLLMILGGAVYIALPLTSVMGIMSLTLLAGKTNDTMIRNS